MILMAAKESSIYLGFLICIFMGCVAHGDDDDDDGGKEKGDNADGRDDDINTDDDNSIHLHCYIAPWLS